MFLYYSLRKNFAMINYPLLSDLKEFSLKELAQKTNN